VPMSSALLIYPKYRVCISGHDMSIVVTLWLLLAVSSLPAESFLFPFLWPIAIMFVKAHIMQELTSHKASRVGRRF